MDMMQSGYEQENISMKWRDIVLVPIYNEE